MLSNQYSYVYMMTYIFQSRRSGPESLPVRTICFYHPPTPIRGIGYMYSYYVVKIGVRIGYILARQGHDLAIGFEDRCGVFFTLSVGSIYSPKFLCAAYLESDMGNEGRACDDFSKPPEVPDPPCLGP